MHMLPACIPSSYPPNVAALMGSHKIDSGKLLRLWRFELSRVGVYPSFKDLLAGTFSSPEQARQFILSFSEGFLRQWWKVRMQEGRLTPPTAKSSTRNTAPTSSPNSDQKPTT